MRVLFGILLGFVIVAVAAALVLATGTWNVAASRAPSRLESRLALYAATRSIQKHAPTRTIPATGADALRGGLSHFKENCVMCHGAPGVPEDELGMGLNPPAPDLTLPQIQKMTDGQLFWVIQNGIRMTGMPAFGPTHSEREIWMMVAFVRHLPEITAAEQQALKAGREEEEEHHQEGAAGGEKSGTGETPAPSGDEHEEHERGESLAPATSPTQMTTPHRG